MEVVHQFYIRDYFFPTWDINKLFLGTFNPACGQALDYYYRRQSNGFWKILKHYDVQNEFDFNVFTDLRNFMTRKRFGCVDVIRSVNFPDEHINDICGKGYSDDKLFRVKRYTREYTFEVIKEFIQTNQIINIFTTWGNRETPNEFKELINDFRSFCNQNQVQLVHLTSPSGRLYKGNRKDAINRSWWEVLDHFF